MKKAKVSRYYLQNKKWILWDSQNITATKSKTFYYVDQDCGLKCKDVITMEVL